MSGCNRFEREGGLMLEQGRALDAHFETCPDCLAARAAHDRITGALAQAAADESPPAGWQEGVWQRVRGRAHERPTSVDPTRPRRRWPFWLAPAGAVAALVLVALWLGQPSGRPSLTVEVREGQLVVRGDDASLGDVLVVTADTAGAIHAALRIYFNDSSLVLDCGQEPSACTRRGDTISARLVLDAVGTYRPVLFIAEATIPPATGALDADAGTALAAGATVQSGEQVPVR